jgi:hypothetical protein
VTVVLAGIDLVVLVRVLLLVPRCVIVLVDVLMRVRMAVASSIRVLVLVRVGVLVRVLVHAFLLGDLVHGFGTVRAQAPLSIPSGLT